MDQKEYLKAMDTAMTHMEYKPRSVLEIRTRLKDKEFDEEIIESCVSELLELGYLDDDMYAREFILSSLERGRGMRRIAEDLRKKGISRDTMEQAVYDLEEQESVDVEARQLAKALSTAEKMTAGKEPDEKLVNKVGRKLMAQGYKNDIVYKVMGAVRDGRLEELLEETEWI